MFLSIFCISNLIQKSSIDFRWLKFMFLNLIFRVFDLVISFLVINWSTLNEIRLWLKIIIKIKNLNLFLLIIQIFEHQKIISLFFFVSMSITDLISLSLKLSSLSLSFFMISSEKLSWFSWSRNVKFYVSNEFNKQRDCFCISWTYADYNVRDMYLIDNSYRTSDSARKKSDHL